MSYEDDCYYVPSGIKESLGRYVMNHISPGGFLQAVLENDLCEAFERADLQNQAALFHIVKYIYNELPSDCWGSPEKVKIWLTVRQLTLRGEINNEL